MSEIRTELDRIISQVEEGHSKATAKGATPQSSKTLANLLTAIDTIPKATAPSMQSKSVTPSESAQTVKPDSGYDGLSQVSVGAISKTYVGSGVAKQAAKTITPSTSSQTAVASGVYTTGAVTVAAIPSTYVKPTATKAAATYTPSTSNQTIAAGTYCSGTQTIKGDANLVADNIKSGVSIFGVAGTLEAGGGGATYYYMDEKNVVETEFGYMYRVSDMTLEEFASRNFEAHFCQGFTDTSFIETVSVCLNKDENTRTNIVDTGNGLKALEITDDALTLKVAYSFTKEYAESNSLQQGLYLSVIADDVYGVYMFIIPLFIVLH